MSETRNTTPAGTRDLVVTRTFDVPAERLFDYFTDPELLKQWWGPKTFTSPAAKTDLRVGGKYLFGMRSAEGDTFWSTGTYREIVRPERLVFTDSFADEEGNVVPATYYGMDEGFPLELLASITFEEQDGKTKLTLHYSGMPANEQTELAGAGWDESLDKLEEVLQREKVR